MIKKPKKLLSNSNILPITILLVLLVGFFFYALKFSSQFFVIIVFSNLIVVFVLLFFRKQLILSQTDINLQKEDYSEQLNLLSLDIEKEKVALSSFRERIGGYTKLKAVAEKLSQCSSCKNAADILADEVMALFGRGDTTTILYLVDPKTSDLEMMAARRIESKINIKFKNGDLFDHWVIKNLKPLLITDSDRDFRFDIEKIDELQKDRQRRSVMIAPLMVGMRVFGLLHLDNPQEDRFSAEDLRFLSTIADLGAAAIENAQLYERIQNFAMKDGLTGLHLRRFLLERMSEELPRQLRRKQELSLLMIDLDHFKKYNDKFGHIAGDIVLKALGDILLKMFDKPGNIVCRYGGEEFVIFLPDCSKEQAKELAESLRKTISEQKIVLRREKTNITVSIGIACFPTDAQIKEELIQKADESMYQAKRKGRNRVCCF
ncbi:MAG: diguanylate cyclase [Candidatus Aceula meridiana]|nr:diguanylate cyclase [Candidatus Aceula meridiana]